MKKSVNFMKDKITGFIAIVIVISFVIVGILLYTLFGPGLDVS